MKRILKKEKGTVKEKKSQKQVDKSKKGCGALACRICLMLRGYYFVPVVIPVEIS